MEKKITITINPEEKKANIQYENIELGDMMFALSLLAGEISVNLDTPEDIRDLAMEAAENALEVIRHLDRDENKSSDEFWMEYGKN